MAAAEQALAGPDPRSFETVLLQCGISPEVANQFRDVRLPFTLKPHQIVDIHAGLYWDRYGLFDEPRTGKTVVMQLLAIYYRYFGRRTLVLCPPILFQQFKRELGKIGGHGLHAAWVTRTGEAGRKQLEDWAINPSSAPDILLTTTNRFIGPVGRAKAKSKRAPNVELLAKIYSHLYWDECHLGLQNEDTQVLAAAETFMEKANNPRLILSTGSPIQTELKACYPCIRLKTPAVYDSRRHFDSLHVRYKLMPVRCAPTSRHPDGLRQIPIIEGYDNQALLTRNLYLQSSRHLRAEVCDIADPLIQVVPITLDPAHMRFYKQVLRDRLVELTTELGEDVLIPLTQASALRQFALRIITNPAHGGFDAKGGNAVLDYCRTLLSGLPPGEKLVIFAHFRSSVEFLVEKFADVNAVAVYGDNGPEGNRDSLEKFRNNEAYRVAVINPGAGGVGFTLGDVCQTAVFAEAESCPAVFEQAAARVLLEGQTRPAAIYILEVLGTFSSDATKRMLNKGKEIQEVMCDAKTLLESLIPKQSNS